MLLSYTLLAKQIILSNSYVLILHMCDSTSVHQGFAHDPPELDEIWCVGSPGGHMYPGGISPKLLAWLPRNGLLNILLLVIFLPVTIQSIICNLGIF